MHFDIWKLFFSPVVWAAIAAQVTAQLFKTFVLPLFQGRKVDVKKFTSYGDFPSAHTAFIIAVTFAAGLTEGWDSPVFALGAVVSAIIIYDILKLRRAVEIALELSKKSAEAQKLEMPAKIPQFKGHSPVEVIAGIVWGIGWAFLVCWVFTLLPK